MVVTAAHHPGLAQLLRACCILMAGIWIAGCRHLPTPSERLQSAQQLASEAGWVADTLSTPQFDLAAYVPSRLLIADVLTIYIEGDGLAWISSDSPSDDPTPINPIGLRLALKDTGPSVYLARPCQYLSTKPACQQRYWTNHRFSPEVIAASNQAIDILKTRFHASKLVLVGYSGGGAIAALVAARRHDVARLVTVAGNMDTRYWVQSHHLSPLNGSLNPADAWQNLSDIPQTHFVGTDDTVVEPAVMASYRSKFPADADITIIPVTGYSHRCCWADTWPILPTH